jgi:hypothetical protein
VTNTKRKISLAPDPWTPSEAPDPYAKVITAAFSGKIHPGDALHMARAILQLNDEMHELREQARLREAALIERLRVLEDAVKFLGSA